MKEDDPSLEFRIVRRVLYLPIQLLFLLTILFILFFVFSDPIYLLFPKGADPQTLQSWRQILGWDKGLFEQYANFIWGMLTFDYGISFTFRPRIPLGDILPPSIAKTAGLVGAATGISIFLGSIFSMWLSRVKDRSSNRIIRIALSFFICIPPFCIALFSIGAMFSISPAWPFAHATGDYYSDLSVFGKFIDVLQHAFLPLISITIAGVAFFTVLAHRKLSDSMADNNLSNYGDSRVMGNNEPTFLQAFSSTLWATPLAFGWILVNAILIEFIFTYKGIGYLLWVGILGYDLPLYVTCIFLIIAAVLLVSTFAHLLRIVIDTIIDRRSVKNRYPSQEPNLNSRIENNISADIAPEISFNWIFSIFKGISRDILGLLSIILIVFIIIISIIGPFISQENPLDVIVPRYMLPQAPSSDHIMGTDFQDKDVFSQMLWGGGWLVLLSIGSAFVSLIIGTLFGVLLTRIGRIGDEIFSEAIYFGIMFPIFIVMITVALLLGRGSYLPFLLLFIWLPVSLYVRNRILALGQYRDRMNINQAIRFSIPNALSMTKYMVIIAIGTLFAIDFFGLGDPNTVTWGWMLERAHAGSAFLNNYYWWWIPPIIATTLWILSLFVFIDTAEEIMRKREEEEESQHAPSFSG